MDKVIAAIDALNSEDPNFKTIEGKQFPKELLYSQRMTRQLEHFENEASQELKIAARAQHICRWKSPREDYPMNRVGYLNWREDLKKMHAALTGEILKEFHYTQTFIDRVQFLIKKKLIKKDKESQTLEDVICLVFLEFYFEDFAAKHEEEKVIDVVQKTWAKMSHKGHDTALTLPLSDTSLELINKALT
ncbi:DUF4202 domain-containing protein [Leeuwenhoekiella sp. NPDC079379]|uniref:DUF4202 domain-containing protein n=1 Tax=Leeuwenhoekiella sp. NPDC079379 TaxID=3364122 RepID=UPI0037C7FD4C